MSFIDLRFAADLLRQGFSRDDIMSLISGKPESDAGNKPADNTIIKEETPPAVSGDKPPDTAPVQDPDPAAALSAAPVPVQAANPTAHTRTEAREDKITFEQLLAKSS